MKDLTIEPIDHKDELNNLDPIGIETKIRELEGEEFELMMQVYPLRHEIAQFKRDLSIAKATYWKTVKQGGI